MRIRILLVAALALGVSAPVAGAAVTSTLRPLAAQGEGLGIRLLDAPTARRNDPRAQAYIVDHLAPGSTIKRRVQVSDRTTAPLAASVYVGGAEVRGGAFVGSPRGTASELSTWSTAVPGSVTLGPGKTADVLVTIAVPRDAAAGERYGVIWAELPPSPGSGLREVNRVGVRIYLSVGTGGEPASSFTVDSLQAARHADGVPVVVAQVHNTGGRALDMRGSLRLTDGPGGLSGGPFAATLGSTLGPGDTEPVTVLLPKAITGGPWTATLDVSSGGLTRRVKAVITFPDTNGSASKPVKATDVPLYKDENTVRLLAVTLIGVVSLALLVVGLLAFLRRRRAVEPAPAG